MERTDLLMVLEQIDPTVLSYQDWINVGMALKQEGYTAADWDQWSRRDTERYHAGECFRKWGSFTGSSSPVTGGTIIQYARDQGWRSENGGHELDWGDEIERDDLVVIDKNWIEGVEVHEPRQWDPANQLIRYLETLFEPGENVGYVVKSWKNEKGKYVPQDRGAWDRTAGQLIEELTKCNGDVGSVIGDYDPEGGAWIRFNPLDGKGVRNENVSDFRYALVESDGMEIDRQNAILRELELPIACLVYSGGKSLHAIVKVDATDYSEYRKRVDYLYDVCQKNGIKVDTQNRNPSRLSRMPGVVRGEKRQFLADRNIGKSSWAEWYEWIEGVNDDLPEPESLKAVWDHMPNLAPCLIDGVLRQGHKMLIAGPSKAGKSFLQIELCIAIAEGKSWLGWQCAQGKVMYVNLELDRASCLHRFSDEYQEMGLEPNHLDNIDIWNLRGKSMPMDKLAPKLIRRAAKKNYIAIIIDPIYKVITGDENSADQMAQFCNQFDKVCTELGVATIYCHHHSKGNQGGKRAMDRASGSGVFARDPDAMLDIIELPLSEDIMKQEENKVVCRACCQFLDTVKNGKWREDVSQDDMCSQTQMMNYCKEKLTGIKMSKLIKQVEDAKKKARRQTAWRIDGTLREFPKLDPINVWFDYPIHRVDDVGILKDVKLEESPSWQHNFSKKKGKEDSKRERMESLRIQFESLESLDEKGIVTVGDLAEAMGTTEKTIRNRVVEYGKLYIKDGIVRRKGKENIE